MVRSAGGRLFLCELLFHLGKLVPEFVNFAMGTALAKGAQQSRERQAGEAAAATEQIRARHALELVDVRLGQALRFGGGDDLRAILRQLGVVEFGLYPDLLRDVVAPSREAGG